MASEWFELADSSSCSGADASLSAPDKSPTTVVDSGELSTTENTPSSRSRVWIPMLAIVAVVVIGAAGYLVWALTHPAHHDDVTAAPLSPPSSSTHVPSPAASSTAASAPQACPGQAKADEHDPAGIVVAFQKAYFGAETDKLHELAAPDSYLREVDWGTALEGVAGAKWCAKTTVSSPSVVDATVTATLPSGDEKVYKQRYHLVKGDQGLRIDSVDDLADKEHAS